MRKKFKVRLLAFLTVFIWASAFPLTKVAMEHFSPNALGLLRCTTAAIILIIIGLFRHISLPRKKDIPLFFLSGAFGFTFYMIAFNTGIQTLTSATSSIIIALTPIMTAIIASKYYGEKIKSFGWFSIALAFLGVLVLLLWKGVFSVNIGLLWTISAAVVFTLYNILNRKLSSKGYSALEIVTYSMICGALLLSVFSHEGANEILNSNALQLSSILYLGALPSAAAYLLWSKAMSIADKTSEVTNFMFVTPLLSTILGFIIINEIPNMGTFIGGIVIIFSIVLFNLKGK